MSKRVYQIAKTLDQKSSALLPDLLAMGYEVTSAASTVTDAEADEILTAFREAGGSDEPGRGHVEVRDVVHDCGVEFVHLLCGNAVYRRNTDLEPTTRKGPVEEYDGVNKED